MNHLPNTFSTVYSGSARQGKPADLVVERVPGSHEVPAGLSLLAESGRFSCLLGLGVVIKDQLPIITSWQESAGNAIQSLIVQHRLPIINGIVVTDDLATAEKVSGSLDRGCEFAHPRSNGKPSKKIDLDLIVNQSGVKASKSNCAFLSLPMGNQPT